MRLKLNNRGFTLTELIVSTAILGIVAMSTSAFMAVGSRSYSSVNNAVRLQADAQIVMAQLQEYTVDCSTGIAWDSTKETLYIVNGDEVHLFTYEADDQTLSYGTGTAGVTPLTASALVADHVTNMEVALKPGKAEIILTMQRNNKTYNGTQIIALRNQPVMADNWGDLWTKMSNLGS